MTQRPASVVTTAQGRSVKILVALACPDLPESDFLLPGNIVHVPNLAGASSGRVLHAALAHGASGLLAERRLSDAELTTWSDAIGGPVFLATVSGMISGLERTTPRVTELAIPDDGLDAVADALRLCEQWYTHRRGAVGTGTGGAVGDARRPVLLVGAGIVNLMTAVYLVDAGYRVTVVDRSPEPGGPDWREYGCTHAGDDARMFTLTEMDNYSNHDPHGRTLARFRTAVDRQGWRARTASPGRREATWIEEFERVPSWLARAYQDDVMAFNREADYERARLRSDHPRLFTDVVLTDGVLRLYDDIGHLDEARERHRRIGALLREPSRDELAREQPGLARALADGTVAGGFFVPGFTVNIHKFVRRLVDTLTERGAELRWDTPVTAVHRDPAGTVTGVECAGGIPEVAHVVVSPGVHGDDLLAGSACAGRIQGVLGGWIRISNDGPELGNSLKLARRGHVTEDANITVGVDEDGQRILVVGSGYGYVGADPAAVDERQLAAIREGLEDTVALMFPDRASLRRSSRRDENYTFKFCIRPWTATSLGIHHVETTAGGGCFVVTGGHNTGGFAQSPAVAHAVIASLAGRSHPMHTLYHPERFAAFTALEEQHEGRRAV